MTVRYSLLLLLASCLDMREAPPESSGAPLVPYDVVSTGAACNQVQYHGGHVLDHVKIQNIFWGGTYWNGAGATLRSQIDQAWRVIGNNRAFYSPLQQYASWLQLPGAGQYLGAVTNNTDPPASLPDDGDVQDMLQLIIAFGLVPNNVDSNMLYVVYLPQGTVSQRDKANGWGGHHDSFIRAANNAPVYYAIITPMTALDSNTLIASHEVDEAVADPAVGQGWDEVGDPCQTLSPRGYRFNSYLLERVWSDADCGCVSTVAKPFASRHDIVWSNANNGDVGLWQMNGSASVRTFGTLAYGIPLAWQIAGTGDFDGDGEGDILWRNTQTGQVGTWLVRGESVTNWNGTPWVAPVAGSQIEGTGDFDGDGITDIVWRDPTTGVVTITFVGAQFTSGNPSWGVPSNWKIAGTGDFDGDHKTDILWRDSNTGDIGIWMMNNRTIRSYEYPGRGIDYVWQIQATGDFNGDGKTDILWRNLFTDEMGQWIMNGGTVAQYTALPSGIPWAWKIMSTGDLDGDGKDDIIWRNTSTGDVGAWLINGSQVRTQDTPARGIPLEWRIVGALADQT